MRIEDDEDVPSLEGSSSDDSYVDAPLENAQVGGDRLGRRALSS